MTDTRRFLLALVAALFSFTVLMMVAASSGHRPDRSASPDATRTVALQ